MKIYRSMATKNILLSLVENEPLMLEDLKELKGNTTDAALEKHVPVMELDGNNLLVKVGSVAHPMLPEHHISFILVETNMGLLIENLKVGEPAEARFLLRENEEVKAVYEYCNLHGLWKLEN